MSNPKPEKILGKKFVRGKPYYKIKWEGSAKDQSSWQSPASLKLFKQIINKYEIKNWGAPLDDKFFDPQLYLTKGFVSKKPTHDKKKAIQKKKQDKRKIQEAQQSSEAQNSGQESQSEQEQIVKVKKQDKPLSKSFQQPYQPRKIKPNSNLNSSKEELQIIDLDSDLQASKLKQKQKSDQSKEVKQNKTQPKVLSPIEKINQETQKKVPKLANNIITMTQLDKEAVQSLVSDPQACDILNPIQKDLGLLLPPKQVNDSAQKETPTLSKAVERNFRCTSAVSLEIEPIKRIHQIAHIYHLEKMNMGNHLYLVQFQNKEMRKLTTDQMLESHPDELVSFLQQRFRAKCMI